MLDAGPRWLFPILYIPFAVNVPFTSLSLKNNPLRILTPNFSFLFDDDPNHLEEIKLQLEPEEWT